MLKSPTLKKLTAFILYCFLLKGHSELLQFFDDDCISDFQQACKDVAQGLDARRSLIGVTTQSVDYSTAPVEDFQDLQNRLQALAADFDTFKAIAMTEGDTSKAKDRGTEDKVRELEQNLGAAKDKEMDLERRLGDATQQIKEGAIRTEELSQEAGEWKAKYEKLYARFHTVMEEEAGI